jgi:hypothetical protein
MQEEDLLPGPGSATKLPAPAALPQSIADVVAWRAARLPAASRAVLNVLAAFPEGTSPSVLAAVTGIIRGRAIESLHSLVEAGLASADRAEGAKVTEGEGFRVRHPAIRGALLAAMTPLLRAQLQRKIAEVLAANAGDDRRQKAGELAHYWLGSNSIPGRERGLGHFLLAAEQARR